MHINNNGFLTANPVFLRDRDVAGDHTGCQVHIPYSSPEVSFLFCM